MDCEIKILAYLNISNVIPEKALLIMCFLFYTEFQGIFNIQVLKVWERITVTWHWETHGAFWEYLFPPSYKLWVISSWIYP